MPFVYIETGTKNIFAKVSGGCFGFLSNRTTRSEQSFALYEKTKGGKGSFERLENKFYDYRKDNVVQKLENTKVFFPCMEHAYNGVRLKGTLPVVLEVYNIFKNLEWCKDFISFDVITKSVVLSTNTPSDVFILVLQSIRNILSQLSVYKTLRKSGVNAKAACLILLSNRLTFNKLTNVATYLPVTSDSNIFNTPSPSVYALHAFFGKPEPRLKTVSELRGYPKYNTELGRMLDKWKEVGGYKVSKMTFSDYGKDSSVILQTDFSCNRMFSKPDESEDVKALVEYFEKENVGYDKNRNYHSVYRASTKGDIEFFESLGFLSSTKLFNYIIEQFNDGVIVTLDHVLEVSRG